MSGTIGPRGAVRQAGGMNGQAGEEDTLGDLGARGKPRMISINAVVTRADGTVEDLGVVSYWHKSPWRRLVWRLGRLFRKGR